MEISERSVRDMASQYNLGLEKGGVVVLGPDHSEPEALAHAYGRTARFFQHFTATHCTYMGEFDGGLVAFTQFEHHMGRHPYFFMPGLMHGSWRGRKVGWGVSANKQWLVEFRSFLLTLALKDVIQQVGKSIFMEVPESASQILGPTGAPLGPVPIPQHSLIYGRPGMAMRAVPIEGITPALTQLLSYITEMKEQTDTPKPNANLGAIEGGAGFGISQILAEVATRHSPFARHIEAGLVELTRFAWSLVREVLREPVGVEHAGGKPRGQHRVSKAAWLTVGPDDLAAPSACAGSSIPNSRAPSSSRSATGKAVSTTAPPAAPRPSPQWATIRPKLRTKSSTSRCSPTRRSSRSASCKSCKRPAAATWWPRPSLRPRVASSPA